MERIDLTKYKNIIFDLGVVLLDIDFNLAAKKFNYLGLNNFSEIYSSFSVSPFFHNYETGKISDEEFLKHLGDMFPNKPDNEKILDAWLSIIIGFPIEKIQLLNKVSTLCNIFLLSNTNSLHAKKYEALFLEKTKKEFHQLFRKIYYSHDIGLRKPDIKAYDLILKENNLKASETLFIDDVRKNLIPAQKLSIKTIHYKDKMDLSAIFGL